MPAVTRSKKSSTNNSPVKGTTWSFEDAPVKVQRLFTDLGIQSHLDVLKFNLEDLIQTAINASNVKDVVDRDITRAWIYCLYERAKDPNSSLTNWWDWLESKIKARQQKSVELEEAARLIISRMDLIRQRQKLKKTKGPISKKIPVSELKAVKARLAAIPYNRALKDRVSTDDLSSAKNRLRRSGSEL